MISKKMQQMLGKSSLIRQMFEEGNRLKNIYGSDNVYDFSLGNPNFPSPKQVNDAIVDIVNSCDSTFVHGYMNNSGYVGVRQTIASKINSDFGTNFGSNNIIMTVGAAGGINVLFKSILDQDDEVIVFAPFFGEYSNYIDNYNAKIVATPPNPPTFIPDLTIFQSLITERTKAVIINSPNNPTGVVYDNAFLTNLAQILTKKQEELNTCIYLVSDEPYRELAYDNISVPYLTKFYDNTIVCYSYSKSLSLAGERIGYIVVPNECDSSQMLLSACNVATRILGFVNAPSLQQLVIQKCIDTTIDISNYDTNRRLLVDMLNELGFECSLPQGAFYLFMKSPLDDDIELCNIAKKFNILIVPGTAFGCKGYVRIAYCVSKKTIIDSMPAFKQLAKLTIGTKNI